LLVELFTEELPPKSLKKLGDAFASGLLAGLVKRGLATQAAAISSYATPRRLAAHIDLVAWSAADQTVARKLMPVAVGLDANGAPTPALTKKLAALGRANIDATTLRTEGDGKSAQLVLDDIVRGATLREGLQAALDESLAALPVAKVMSYQLFDGATTVQFVRPVHGLVALHGTDVVPIAALGHTASRITHGHRFQGAKSISLAHADEYEAHLESEGGVLASFEKRKAEIHRLLRTRAQACGDTLGEPEDYAALLDEVTALVEMPTVYVGKFDAEFLSVPAECLILTMKLNQKYFPLFLPEGGLSSRFLIVSNMRLDDPANVIEGNERVVRPRLADARFFFETDKKTRLVDRLPKLDAVVYHNKLGSQGERVARVAALAGEIAKQIGADETLARRAAQLAKADLVTDMVGEFPELQGVMGRYYALHDGESRIVADAIAEHYQPRFAGDALPGSPVALAVAMADKLETLAGLFGIGQQPTGDKDPFALRRHAIGIWRMIVECKLQMPMANMVNSAFNVFPKGKLGDAHIDLESFLIDRLRVYLRDKGYSADEVEAVLDHLEEGAFVAMEKLPAIREFTKLPEAANLAAANKRIGNILKKSSDVVGAVDVARLAEVAERDLHAAFVSTRPVFEQHLAQRDFTAALKALAPLKTPVDAFFEHVMVNVDDAGLRANRLALLSELHTLMNRVADLSKLAA
jgi:glycyl-tRNA synthetase beta chain